MKLLQNISFTAHLKEPFDFKEWAVCFANGDFDENGLILERVSQAGMIIAVDGGLKHCNRVGLVPNLLVGDFDSAEPDLVEQYKYVASLRLNQDKDETDLECALQQIDFKAFKHVSLLGWNGKRTDHLLGNLALANRYCGKLFLESKDQWAFALSEQEDEVELPTRKGQIFSAYSLFESANVISKGLKWELNGSRAFNNDFFSQSNECLGDSITLKVLKGKLFCIMEQIF